MWHIPLHTGETMPSPILEVRSHTTIEEIDYVYLITTLQSWAAPRNVISRLVKSGDLIRVKKGIYLFGPHYAKRPYSLEILANKIYGPSYVSREYALSYWGIIPEGVKEVTCMTTGKKKNFETPVGRFSYLPQEAAAFSLGVTYLKVSDDAGALIATPEKALFDLLMARKEKNLTIELLRRLLFEDLRIEPDVVYSMNKELLKELSKISFVPKLILQLISEKPHA